MKIDTLVFSGASTKITLFVGILRCLYEQRILTPELEGIHTIYTCSISTLIVMYMLLGLSLDVMEHCCMQGNYENLINLDEINITGLVDSFGLVSNELLGTLVINLLKEKFNREDMTLQELYDYKPICLSVKCANITKNKIDYINHTTDPDLSIITLLRMTTAIPFLFKPVIYKGDMYLDGGVNGGYPVDKATDNYLGVWIRGNDSDSVEADNLLSFMYKLGTLKQFDEERLPQSNTIMYYSDIHFSNFTLSPETKQELITLGYNTTLKHIQTHSLTNDLLSEHLEDTTPTRVIAELP